MRVTFVQAFVLTMLIVFGFFLGGILIGSFLNPYLLIPYYLVLIGCGIAYYRHLINEAKKRCPNNKDN